MRYLLAVLLLLVAACRASEDGDPVPLQSSEVQTEEVEWLSNPADGVELDTDGDVLRITTGPHVVAWPAGAGELVPPYTVTATLRKQSGRTHEGYGLVFGGARLDGPEARQSYSYFLVRGDGSFLVRRREGSEVPIVRPWTGHPAVQAEDGEGRASNELSVHVQADEVLFLINGVEVDRQPSEALRVEGTPGVRAAHALQLEVTGFRVTSGEAAVDPQG